MRKMSRPVRKVNAQVVGFDVHKKELTYCILDRQGREIANGGIAADRSVLTTFLDRYVGRKKGHFAFEASGYSMWVHDLLVERYGRERVHVGHAKKIRAIANSPRKNDDNDAFWLAYLTWEGRLPEAYVPEQDLRDLRIATRCRIRTIRRRTALASMIKALLAQVGVVIGSKLNTRRGRESAARWAEQLEGIRAVALQEYLEEFDRMDRQVAAWDTRLDELAEGFPAIDTIAEHMPGFGRKLAAVVCAEAGPLERFKSAKEFGSYTGLTPTDRSSGGRVRHGRISREGSAFLRWALHEAVMACEKTKRGPGLAVGDWTRRHKKRMGYPKRAQCAAARKLGESLWRLFHLGECFDPARAFGGSTK